MQEADSCALEVFIRKTERVFLNHPVPRRDIFNAASEDAPRLRKGPGKDNQVIVFPGSFNPPHEGHRELLSRAFLGTDQKVIAAIILPAATSKLAEKENVGSGEKKFLLTGAQRAQLWKDDFVGRFSWVFPGALHQFTAYIKTMRLIAEKEGYQLTFTSLVGAELLSLQGGGLHGRQYGNGGIVCSDINRAAGFITVNPAGQHICHRLPQCGTWSQIVYNHASDLDPIECIERQDFCSACWKLHRMCPHLRELETLDDIIQQEPSLARVMDACHRYSRKICRCRPDDKLGLVYFLPSHNCARKDPQHDAGRSADIRKLVLDHQAGDDVKVLYDNLKHKVLNPHLLMTFLGLEVSDDDVTEASEKSGHLEEEKDEETTEGTGMTEDNSDNIEIEENEYWDETGENAGDAYDLGELEDLVNDEDYDAIYQ